MMLLFERFYETGFVFIISFFTTQLHSTCLKEYLIEINEYQPSETDLIDSIYVINLEKRPLKWEVIKKNFGEYGISLTHVLAYDGSLIQKKQKMELILDHSER